MSRKGGGHLDLRRDLICVCYAFDVLGERKTCTISISLMEMGLIELHNTL